MPSIFEEALGRPHPCQEEAGRNVRRHPATTKGRRRRQIISVVLRNKHKKHEQNV